MPLSIEDDFAIDGLSVDTRRLDEILDSLARKIREQHEEISKIPVLEEQHSALRRDIQHLELKVSSKYLSRAVTSYIEEDAFQIESNDGFFDSSESKYSEITDRISSRREKGVHHEVERLHKSLDNVNLNKIRREVVSLKAIISQLQDDLNMELANSVTFVKQLDRMKQTIISFEKGFGSPSSTTSILDMKRNVSETYDSLLNSLKELESHVMFEMNTREGIQAAKLKESFGELESSLKERMSLWDSKFSTFAKRSEVNALIETFNDENQNNQIRLDFLEKGNLRNELALSQMKHQAALLTIKRCYLIWKRRVQLISWSRWQYFVKWDMEQKSKTIQRKRKIRQLLIRHWYSRKKKAWTRWHLFLQWHKRIEGLKYQAVKLIHNRMEEALTIPVRNAFNRLRRCTVAEKITKDRLFDEEKESITDTAINQKTNVDGEFLASEIKEDILINIQSNYYDLSELLNTFENDKDGAIHTLAQEVHNLRVYDISKVRRDMQKGDKLLNESFHQSLGEEVCSLDTKIDILEKKVDHNFKCLSVQLPEMKRHISELRNSLHGTINRVKIIEQTHRDRIELLCESKEVSDEKIADLESNLQQAQTEIRGLEYNNDRSQNLVNTLLGKMQDFEQNQIQERQIVNNHLSVLENELTKVNSQLSKANKERELLNENLNETKHELIQTKIAMNSSIDNVHGIFDSHGLRKPKINLIVEDGVLYEKIAKEKNYVVQLNCVTDGSKEVDVASHISSFSHDYAAWISYKADHEALQLVVVGNNPDDAIYVEDEMEARRRNLIRK